MKYPKAYLDFLIFFHASRDYFECHEVLEEYWKKARPSDRQPVWVGLIQIAVAHYHHRRKNYPGALKMMESALRILQTEKESLIQLGLDAEQLLLLIQSWATEIKEERPYHSHQLPLIDPELIQLCQDLSKQKGLKWNSSSDLTNTYLLHKHQLRDRKPLIIERQKNKQSKNRKP